MSSQYIPAAPMSPLIRVATAFTYALMTMILGFGLFSGPRELVVWILAMVAMPISFMLLSPLFMVRGYLVEGNQLRIQRLGWCSTIDLSTLRDFYVDPDAMKGGWRVCGNGGLFCFSGYFRSKKFGYFRPFVTNLKSCVVIRTAQKTVVVSPAEPEALIAALTEQFGAPAGASESESAGAA
jgi:hypothetical protein